MQQAQQQLPAQPGACARQTRTSGRRVWHLPAVRAGCTPLQGLVTSNSQQASMQLGGNVPAPQGYGTTTQPVQLAMLMQPPALHSTTPANSWGLACAASTCLPVRPRSPSPDVVAQLPTLHSPPSHREHSSAWQPTPATKISQARLLQPEELHRSGIGTSSSNGLASGLAVGRVDDQPPPNTQLPELAAGDDRQARALMNSIKSCADWQSLRALLAVQHRQFNMRHVTAAVHHCSSLVARYTMSAAERAEFQQWLTQWVLPACQDLHVSMRPRELSTVLHALASMQYVPPPSLVSTLCQRMLQLIHHCSMRDMASMLWSLTKLLSILTEARASRSPQHAAHIMQPAATRAAAIVALEQPGNGAAVARASAGQGSTALASLQQAVARLAQHLLARSLPLLHTGNGQDLANVVLCACHLHKLGVQPPSIQLQEAYQQLHHVAAGAAGRVAQGKTEGSPYEQLPQCAPAQHISRLNDSGQGNSAAWQTWQNTMLTHSIDMLAGCNGQALANIAHGLANLPGQLTQHALVHRWRAAFEAAASRQCSSCSTQAWTAMVTSAAPLGWTAGSPWVAQLLHATQEAMKDCSLDDLCDMGLAAPALMRPAQGHTLDVGVMAWWRAYEDAVAHRLNHAEPKHYALLLTSLAHGRRQLGVVPSRSTISRWFAGAAPRLHQFSSLDLSQCMSACVMLSITPPVQFMQAAVQHLRRGMHQVPITHTSNILVSLARLRYDPGWQFYLELYNACIAQHRSFQQQQPPAINGATVHSISSSTSIGLTSGQQPGSSTKVRQHQHSGEPRIQLQELSMLVSSLASLHQRPMACWVEWLVNALPAAVSKAHRQLQAGSHCRATAQCFASLIVGLLRLHVMPPPVLLQQLMDMAVSAAPYLPPKRCAHLLWAVMRLAENAANSYTGVQRSRQRRSRLLGVNQRLLRTFNPPVAMPCMSAAALVSGRAMNASAGVHVDGDVSSVLCNMLQQRQHVSEKGSSTNLWSNRQLARGHRQNRLKKQARSGQRGTLHHKKHTSLVRLGQRVGQLRKVARKMRSGDASTDVLTGPASVMAHLQQPMMQLLTHFLSSSKDHLHRLSYTQLNSMLYAVLPAARMLACTEDTSNLWTCWLAAWLAAHTAFVQIASTAAASNESAQHAQQQQQVHKAQQVGALFISASRVSRIIQTVGLQQTATANASPQADSLALDATLKAALRAWLQAVFQAAADAHVASAPAQLPAVVELAHMCGLQSLASPCVQCSLLAAQPALSRPLQARTSQSGDKKLAPKGVARVPKIRVVELLQLAQAVVASGVHEQAAAVDGSPTAAGTSTDASPAGLLSSQHPRLKLQEACRTLVACLKRAAQEFRLLPRHKRLALLLVQRLSVAALS